ncbi:hypothetical protein OYC64_017535 [Pagothenia borchgrevinki]|uniref:Uncharacterized protein n=1 Tax=Pagothenia borchgrevinki TaxID=8213 RepID=A0ABD2GNB1_PAGBO
MMLLLLVLLAGCSLTAAQTATPQTSPAPLTEVVPVNGPTALAVLVAALQSTQALNLTNIGPTLQELHTLIQHFAPQVNFRLTVKEITKV